MVLLPVTVPSCILLNFRGESLCREWGKGGEGVGKVKIQRCLFNSKEISHNQEKSSFRSGLNREKKGVNDSSQ